MGIVELKALYKELNESINRLHFFLEADIIKNIDDKVRAYKTIKNLQSHLHSVVQAMPVITK
jgi:hypothetical protein